MSYWTPEAVKRVLESRDPVELRRLGGDLLDAATTGRAVVLYRKPWLSLTTANKDDDVHDVVLALFDNKARLLRKFGDFPGFRPNELALRRYVTGITYFVLQRKCQKYRPNQELLMEHLNLAYDAAGLLDGFTGLERGLDLEQAVNALSDEDHLLFHLLYVEQFGVVEICEHRSITVEAFQQRKSRLLKRLRALLTCLS
jgi:DNA-directed RNA polymerase specialized sigma24 family protein